MLNIGKLSPGATEYYVGEVATSAEDYYSGRGEHPGRWVGSLARELGLSGQVDPDHFRRVLRGQDPHTGEDLVTAQGPRHAPRNAAAMRPTAKSCPSSSTRCGPRRTSASRRAMCAASWPRAIDTARARPMPARARWSRSRRRIWSGSRRKATAGLGATPGR